MNTQAVAVISLILFVLTILFGVKKKINLGILGLAVAFIFGFFVMVEGGSMSSAALAGQPIISLFPMKIFWPILGISLMLSVGNVNGTYNIAIKWLVKLAGGRRALLPVIVFLIMLLVVSLGVGTAGVTVLLCTIAINIAYDQDIDPVFMLMALLCGCFIGVGSPMSIIGIICNNFSTELYGETIAPDFMYLRALIMSVLCFALVYIGFRGWKLERWPKVKGEEIPKMDHKQLLTLGGLVVFIVLGLVFGLDLGLCGILVCAVLLLFNCADQKKVIADVPWSSVLMICGMCMLVGVVSQAGGMDLMTDVLSKVMTTFTVKPIYALIGGLLGLVSSITSVILPTMLPTIPDIATSTGVNPYSLFLALAFCANATCCCPVSSMGAIAYGIMGGKNKWDQDAMFKKMFLWSIILMVFSALMAAVGLCG